MTKLQTLIDEAVELEIALAGKNVEIANLKLAEPGSDYFYFSGQRDHWAKVMRDCILSRSAAQVARLEAARVLDHA